MKWSILLTIALSAFVAAHGPDDDGDEAPKGVAAPKPAGPALPKTPALPSGLPKAGGLPSGFPKAGGLPAGLPKAGALPKGIPSGLPKTPASAAAPKPAGHSHGYRN